MTAHQATNGLVHIPDIVSRIAAGVSSAQDDASFDASQKRKVHETMHGECPVIPSESGKVPEHAV